MITAKFSSNCSKCKTKLLKGTCIYYWPSSREVFCTKCGEGPYRQFLSSAADEDVYNGCGNPYAYWYKKGKRFPFFTEKTLNKKLSARHYRFAPQKPWKHFWFFREYHLLQPFQYRISDPFCFWLFQLHSLFGSRVYVTPNSGNFTTVWQYEVASFNE